MEKDTRKEKKLSGCLLLAPLNSSTINLCGLCENKSTDTGNLAVKCVRAQKR